MTIAIIPASVIEQIDCVVTRLGWTVLVARQDCFTRGNHASGRGCDDVHHSLRSTGIESVMVVNLFVGRLLAPINERRLVGHLRMAGEPPLLQWIDECAWFDPR